MTGDQAQVNMGHRGCSGIRFSVQGSSIQMKLVGWMPFLFRMVMHPITNINAGVVCHLY